MAANMENLPEHLLLDILTLVPASELICNCRLVCSHWRDLVDLPVLWKRKFQKRDHDSSPKPLSFYIFSRLKKNLIKNPDGQDGLDSWEIQTPAEGHWETEEQSIEDSKIICRIIGIYWGNDEDAPVQVYKCFAACNGPCSKSQLITLKDEGYWDELMDEARPTIEVKDWFHVLFTNCPQGVRHILFEHKAHTEPHCPRLLKYLSPQQGPSDDGEPSWSVMRVLQSSITLHPPPTAKVDGDCHYLDNPDPQEHSSSDKLPDDDYQDYEDYPDSPDHSSNDDSEKPDF
uniref:F-box only protein 44-like n=1 Tax=Podarcis muralis TaxID=64176 RepID=UPI00109F1379|nr:F-box only protein 44-like [Podarcis muralis]